MPKKYRSSSLYKAQQGGLLPFYWRNGIVYDRRRDGDSMVPTFSQAMDYSIVLIEGIRVNIFRDGVSNGAQKNAQKIFGFRLKDHVTRLLQGAKILGLKCLYSEKSLLKALQECVFKNLLFLKEQKSLASLYVRPKLFLSDSVIKPFAGSRVEVVIEMFPLGNYTPPTGVTATLSDFVRTHRYSDYRTKGAGKYPEYGMLRDSTNGLYQDVFQLGLGHGGKLFFTEGTTSNVFFVKEKVLYTPAVSDFCLEGITRATVIALAKFAGMKVKEQEVPLSMILECDEIFFTGTASFITPVTKIGKWNLGVGPVTKKLAVLFENARSGKIQKFYHFLTPFSI